jgi:hypothetical protein
MRRTRLLAISGRFAKQNPRRMPNTAAVFLSSSIPDLIQKTGAIYTVLALLSHVFLAQPSHKSVYSTLDKRVFLWYCAVLTMREAVQAEGEWFPAIANSFDK